VIKIFISIKKFLSNKNFNLNLICIKVEMKINKKITFRVNVFNFRVFYIKIFSVVPHPTVRV
jgi:hypothetical protein